MEHRLTEKDIKLFNAVARMQNGEMEAFNEVYEFSYKYLYKIVYDILKDSHNAEDLLQETYMKIYEKIDTLQDVRTFYVWAGRIATNNALRFIQKYRKEVLATADEEGSTDFVFENAGDDKEAFIPESIIVDQEKRKIIGDILDNLSTEQKLAVQYFYFEEMSVNEIADSMGCSSGTIKSRLNYARNAIKEAVLKIEKTQGTKLYSLGGGSALWIYIHIASEKDVAISTAAIIDSIVSGAAISDGVVASGATSGAAQIGANAGSIATGAGTSAENALVEGTKNIAESALQEASSESTTKVVTDATGGITEAASREVVTDATRGITEAASREVVTDATGGITEAASREVVTDTAGGITEATSREVTKEVSKKAAKSVVKKAAKTTLRAKLAIAAAATVTVASVTTAVIINNNKENNEPKTESSSRFDEANKLDISENGELAPEIQKTYLGDVDLGIMYANSDGVILQVANDNFEYGFAFLSTPEYKGQDVSKITELDDMYSQVKELALNDGVKYYYAGAEIQQDCEPVIYKWVDILEKARGNLGNDRDYYEYVYNEFRGFVINTSDGIYYVETCYVGEGEYNYSVDDEDDGYSFNVVDSETGLKFTTEYYDYGNNDIEFTCRIPSKLYKIEGNYSEPSIGDESDESKEEFVNDNDDFDDNGMTSLGSGLIKITYDPEHLAQLEIIGVEHEFIYHEIPVNEYGMQDTYSMYNFYDQLEASCSYKETFYAGYEIEEDAEAAIYNMVDILDKENLYDKDYKGALERELDGFYLSTPDGGYYIKFIYERINASYEPVGGDHKVEVTGECILYRDENATGNGATPPERTLGIPDDEFY